MYTEILIRYGEISIKGKNRKVFESILVKNIKTFLQEFAPLNVEKTWGRMFIRNIQAEQVEEMIGRLKKIPGIVSVSPVVKVPLDIEQVKEMSVKVLADALPLGGRFKVEAHRANKRFEFTSPEINQILGAYLHTHSAHPLKTDVHTPESTVFVEVRDEAVYLYSKIVKGPGGLPIGSGGRGLLLLSGGIDSPVAGWMGMKRGVIMDALHFESYPFTSERSKEKVIELARILSQYSGKVRLFMGHFTEIQKAIGLNCPERFHITIMRRMMLRMATELTRLFDQKVLFTGESIGQVASQTLESMEVINAVTCIPVLRPLVCMDKTEIITIAREIGTFETSILPYEDCCTVFVPADPIIKPKISEAEKAERNLPIQVLIDQAIRESTLLIVRPNGVEEEYKIAEIMKLRENNAE